MYLVDTNVVRELRKPRPDPRVTAWLRHIPDRDLFLSAVTIGELQLGVETLRLSNAGRAREMEGWVDQVAGVWNILPMDKAAFRRWGLLMRGGPRDLIADAPGGLIANTMIAATAHVHDLTVVTRNISGFLTLDVATLDPFAVV